jgi:hypothetical protein
LPATQISHSRRQENLVPFSITSPNQTVAVGRYTVDPQVVAAVRNASATTGTRFDTLVASAALESGLDPSAKASSSTARGLFQFTEQAWLATIRQFGAAHGLQADAAAVVARDGQLTVDDPAARARILNLRFDPSVSATMAGDHLQSLASSLTASIGHAPDATETYLAHFLGGAGATQMLKAAQSAPMRQAADVLPEAARANPMAFSTADGSPRSAAQFVQRVRDRLAQAFADVGSTMPQGALAFAGQAAAGTASGIGGGSAGRGLGLAHASATAPERAMTASLVDVFTRMDRGETSPRMAHGKHGRMLPFGLVSTLQSTGAQVQATPSAAATAGT